MLEEEKSKVTETAIAPQELDDLRARIRELEGQLGDEKAERGNLELRLQSIQQDSASRAEKEASGGDSGGNDMMTQMIIDGMASELDEKTAKIEALQKELDEARMSSKNTASEGPVADAGAGTGDNAMTKMIMDSMSEELEAKTAKVEELQKALEAAQSSGGGGNDAMSKMIMDSMSEELEKCQKELAELKESTSASNASQSTVSEELKALQDENARLGQELEKLKSALERGGAKAGESSASVDTTESSARLAEENSLLRAEVAQLKQALELATQKATVSSAEAVTTAPKEESLQERLARLKQQSISPRKADDGKLDRKSSSQPSEGESPAEKLARLKAQLANK